MQEASCPAREREGGDRRAQACEQRDPFHAREHAEQGASDDEHHDPQWARRGLDAFAGVEHRAVPGEDLVDDAQVDERVLVHPAVLPTADRDHERGNVRRRGRAESGQRDGRRCTSASSFSPEASSVVIVSFPGFRSGSSARPTSRRSA